MKCCKGSELYSAQGNFYVHFSKCISRENLHNQDSLFVEEDTFLSGHSSPNFFLFEKRLPQITWTMT